MSAKAQLVIFNGHLGIVQGSNLYVSPSKTEYYSEIFTIISDTLPHFCSFWLFALICVERVHFTYFLRKFSPAVQNQISCWIRQKALY